MRFFITCFLLYLSVQLLMAQKTAVQYYTQIPQSPSDPCGRGDEGHTEFMRKTNVLLDEIKLDLNARNKKAKEFMKNHEDRIRENALANSGMILTPEQMRVMKQENKHMTAAQKKQLADEVMQQNMNVSMQEIEKMKKDNKHVDPAAAENWAKAYSTELEAEREINPEKVANDQKRSKEMLDLQKKIDAELKILNGGLNEFTERFTKLQEEADTAYVRLRELTDPISDYIREMAEELRKEKERCGCPMEEKSQQVFEETRLMLEKIQLLEYHYCLPLTPQYCDILMDYKVYISTQFDRCDKIEKLQEELQYKQTGVRNPEFVPGSLAVKSVQDYVICLSNVFKYKISDNPLTQ